MWILPLFALYTGIILMPTLPVIENSLYEWIASYYDYNLWDIERSKKYATCAFHSQYKDYGMYRVCNIENWKCVDCKNNDWMRNDERVVDLSSYAFRKIWNLKRWLLNVTVKKL